MIIARHDQAIGSDVLLDAVDSIVDLPSVIKAWHSLRCSAML